MIDEIFPVPEEEQDTGAEREEVPGGWPVLPVRAGREPVALALEAAPARVVLDPPLVPRCRDIPRQRLCKQPQRWPCGFTGAALAVTFAAGYNSPPAHGKLNPPEGEIAAPGAVSGS